MKFFSDFCNYLGSLIGFIGALFTAIAMSAISSGGQPNPECVKAGKTMSECMEFFVVMKHPILNILGLILICIGFGIQFIPAITRSFMWLYKQM